MEEAESQERRREKRTVESGGSPRPLPRYARRRLRAAAPDVAARRAGAGRRVAAAAAARGAAVLGADRAHSPLRLSEG